MVSGIVRSTSGVDVNRVSANVHCKAGDGEAVGVLGVEARPHIKGPAVCLADDDASIELTFREREAGMRTRVFHREDLSIHVIEAYVDLFDADAQATTLWDVG